MIASGYTGTSLPSFGHGQRLLAASSVQPFVQPLSTSPQLALPADPATPLIMVATRAQWIPMFRALLEQRRAFGATGEHWLLLGDRHLGGGCGGAPHAFYHDAIFEYVRDGTVTRIDAAFPFDADAASHVAQRMFENARGLWAWIDLGASVYICGDPMQVTQVEMTLTELIAEQGHMADERAAAYIAEMARDRRYQRHLN